MVTGMQVTVERVNTETLGIKHRESKLSYSDINHYIAL